MPMFPTAIVVAVDRSAAARAAVDAAAELARASDSPLHLGGTVARALLGTTPTTAVRRSPASVLVVRASGEEPSAE